MQFTMGMQFIQSENTAPYPQQDKTILFTLSIMQFLLYYGLFSG